MKGNGIDRHSEVTKIELHGQIMDCDYCGLPMDFAEYSSHQCDGLNGLNPWQEKTRNAVWHKPGVIGGAVNARGVALTGAQVAEASNRVKIRRAMRRCSIGVLILAVAVLYLAYG